MEQQPNYYEEARCWWESNSSQKSHANSTSSSAGEESELEDKNNTSDTTDHDLFEKWVESEGMKRITFMTFYLDIIDFIKFRHNPQILFYQLQLLNLPCDDEHLWELTEVNGSFKKSFEDNANYKIVTLLHLLLLPIKRKG